MIRDKVRCGCLMGEHGFDKEHFKEEVQERVISRGLDYLIINTTAVKNEDMPSHEQWVEWSEYLAKNGIYFVLVRMAQNSPLDKPSRLERRTVLAMTEAAGEYFLGDCIAEPGHAYAAKEAGYYLPKNGRTPNKNYIPRNDAADMADARRYYVESVRKFVKKNEDAGMPASASIEATMLSKYNIEAGIRLHILETPNGDPDIMMPSIRGAVRNLGDNDSWGTLIAHEWYGGMRHSDMQKRRRLELVAKWAYMSGADTICLESGDVCISSYDQEHGRDSEVCRDYRNMLADTVKLARTDKRPAGGPKATFGILMGRDDGWTGFCQSSLWNQFGREDFGYSDAEGSWRMLTELGHKRKWGDIFNYGEEDLSAYPAYGTFDIVPVEADVDHLSKYDHLVFLGWNTMSEEIMDKLTEYARRGGRLLLSGAHLNCNAKRGGEFIPPSPQKLEALCGCRFNGRLIRSNYGTKLYSESLDKSKRYPGTESFFCDPIFASAYTDYMETEPRGCRVLGYTSNAFISIHTKVPSVIENAVGKGIVTLVTSVDYPGSLGLYPLYNALFREAVSSSARECEIKVIAPDKLRYTVYDGNKIYLLNTDGDLPITVKIIFNGKEEELTLDALELRALQL